jgi:hypothetical protein
MVPTLAQRATDTLASSFWLSNSAFFQLQLWTCAVDRLKSAIAVSFAGFAQSLHFCVRKAWGARVGCIVITDI